MYNIINPPNNNNNKSLFKIHLWNLVNVHSPSQISPVIKVSSMIHPNQKCPFLTTALPVVSALHAACLSSADNCFFPNVSEAFDGTRQAPRHICLVTNMK